MASVNPKILLNFNENSATTIRDYSENGNDGVGTNLTVTSSSRVGYDAVFNGLSDQISLGNITDLSGQSEMACHFSAYFNSSEGIKNIINKSNQFVVTYTNDTDTITVSLFVGTGTATVSTVVALSTWYDISIVYVDNILKIYVDNGLPVIDETKSGVIDTNTNIMYLGDTGLGNSAFFLLNEFKLYAEAITTTNIAAFINAQNGIEITSATLHGYALGDIIGGNINTSVSQYAIVTYVGSTTVYRLQPLTEKISIGILLTRVGHLWDAARQWMFVIDDTPQICFYDGISLSSDVLSASKKVYCMTKDGIIKNSSTKTTTYQVLSTDQRIYVDSSVGAFAVTLELAPVTNRELEIIDSVGSCGTNAVTVIGNGNNINGAGMKNMNANYDSWNLVYNGTQWNLKYY